MRTPDIVVQGKDNGENMVIHYETGRGIDIFGLAIPNIYAGTEWDLGPTWCYLIIGRKITLIDTGRFGNLEAFLTLLKLTGKEPSDIDRIIISHSHEDHDGNLPDIISLAQAELWAHAIYNEMISYHSDIKDGARHPQLPGSCRLCYMPEKFYRNCLAYHRKRSSLSINLVIEDSLYLPDDGMRFIFTPGHSPDAICVVLDDEVVFTADTILPGITPHPSLTHDFEVNRRILPEKYRQENRVYGLMNYIKSLDKIIHSLSQSTTATFPAHRLFYGGRFHIIDSPRGRAREIIQFHIERCREILKIIGDKPADAEEITMQYFSRSQLTGTGSRQLAQAEILSHLEIMKEFGDIRQAGANGDKVQSTGSERCVKAIRARLSG